VQPAQAWAESSSPIAPDTGSWNGNAGTDSEEAHASIVEVERILPEARDKGCVSRKVDTQHVLDDAPFDPYAEEYQIIAPIAGG
jgi:hypothetical protein